MGHAKAVKQERCQPNRCGNGPGDGRTRPEWEESSRRRSRANGRTEGWKGASGCSNTREAQRNSHVRSANSMESRKRVNLFDESLKTLMNEKLAKLETEFAADVVFFYGDS